MRTRAKRLIRLFQRRRELRRDVAQYAVDWGAIEQRVALELDPIAIELAVAAGLTIGGVLDRLVVLEEDAIDDDWLGQEEAYA